MLVDDGIGQLGRGDEVGFQLVIVAQRIFARLLVDGEHAFHQIGILLGEFLADIENAPGIGAIRRSQARRCIAAISGS